MEISLHLDSNHSAIVEVSPEDLQEDQEKEYASEIQFLKGGSLSAPPQAIQALVATYIQSLSQ